MEKMRYIGEHYGTFTDEKSGEVRSYHSFFLASEFENVNADYHHSGLKPEKFSLSPSCIPAGGLEFGTPVIVEFDRRGRLTSIVEDN